MSNDWDISDEEFLDDSNVADDVIHFRSQATALSRDWAEQVQIVANRIANIHQTRDLNGLFLFGFDANASGGLLGASISVHLPERDNMCLSAYVDLGLLTDDPDARLGAAALAIKSNLMGRYAIARNTAVACALLIEETP